MKHLTPLLLFIFLAFNSVAQDSEPIVTDRPTQTPASGIMPAGRFLLETGFLREASSPQLNTFIAPNLLLRYGVNEFFEVRLQQDYTFLDFSQGNESGFNSLKIGLKIKLAEEEGWKPQMSFLGNLTTTTGQEPVKNESISSDFSLVFSNTLSERFSIGYSLGIINGESGFDSSLYTFVFSYALLDALTAFVEPYAFGLFDRSPNDHRINGGLIYLLKDNIQIDASAGLGLSDISPDSFVAMGFSIGF